MDKPSKWFSFVNRIKEFLSLQKKQLGNDYCAFCDPKVLDNQKFYEDDLVIALYQLRPIFPGHFLIIPKRHVERFEMLNEEEIVQIGRAIKKLNKIAEKVFGISSYLLAQKNGIEVGQSVPHVHFHYIPRKVGDDSIIKLQIKIYLVNFRKIIKPNKMKEVIKKLKKAIEEENGKV